MKAHLVDSERAASTYSDQNEKQQAELEEASLYQRKPLLVAPYWELLKFRASCLIRCLLLSSRRGSEGVREGEIRLVLSKQSSQAREEKKARSCFRSIDGIQRTFTAVDRLS